MSENIVDKVTDDDSKIIITNRSVKWVIGILLFGVTTILGFAWGLYVTLDGKVDTQYNKMNENITNSETKILQKIESLKDKDVKENTKSNNKQDVDIGRLYERTDSYSDRLNSTTVRPTINNDDTTPTMGQ